jgi:lipid II:glycine glycyltransferase (peptidoglycan interpeptide bridge formation enzyme)
VHVAADDDHRRLSPNSILASSMVEDASNSGKKVFDFFGVVPADVTDHAWSNFSEFKRSFGGEQMAFIGTWEKPVNRMKYAAQNLVHKLSSRKK